MKRRIILWVAVLLAVLTMTRCHFVFPPLRRADAVITVKTTGYCACPQCGGWKFNWLGLPVMHNGEAKSIGRTASMRMARPGTVAADPKIFPPGTRFYIPGYGWGRAEDTGCLKGGHLDLYFWWHINARNWGERTKKVKVWYERG